MGADQLRELPVFHVIGGSRDGSNRVNRARTNDFVPGFRALHNAAELNLMNHMFVSATISLR